MPWIIRWCAIVCAMLGAAMSALAQNPQSYPDRPVRLVVAFTAGGATDTLTRQIFQDLQQTLGQPVVVENRPGANGYLAWNYVASSEPDGYTLLMAENALGISQALYKKTPFDPLAQYDPIASVATSPLILVAANNVPANNVAELIALSRTVPQKMNYASAGIGSVAHLVFEVFKAAAGMEAVHVPYKGGGQAIGDIIAGHVEMTMAAVSVAKSLVEAGRIKAIAVTGPARSPALPDVPTLRESGLPLADVELRFWYGVFAPKGVPDAVKAKLDKAVSTVLADPHVRERLAKLDIEPAYAPADVLRTKLVNEITNWSKFIDEHGIKAE
jgi:tripartite-type tricarboxylate transporter receptor subunit TctC